MRRISNGTTTNWVDTTVRVPSGLARVPFRWIAIALLLGVAGAKGSRAQTAEAQPKAVVATPSPVVGSDSLARFVSSDRLIFLIENVGLKTHADAWQKTNAYKLLTGTPLGTMFELIGAQFLDQILATDATRKVTGAEIVSLIKHAAQNGWILAINSVDKGPRPYRITLVFKGAAGKTIRPVTSRLLGAAMGDIRPRTVRRENRTIIAVDIPGSAAPQPAATPAAEPAKGAAPGVSAKAATAVPPPAPVTWIWWPEQDDLVVGIYSGDDGALMVNTIDGKAPSAVNHPVITASKKAENSFQPISTRFVDLTAIGQSSGQDWLLGLLGKTKAITGSNRIVQRVGIENQALHTSTRLASAKPFTSLSALFEVPSFKKSALIPMPEGVHSFATFSIKAERLPGLIDHFDPTGELKTKLAEFTQALKASSRVDLEKDLLARLGPKMSVYLSPVRSAAAEDESLSLQSLLSGGINVTSLLAISRPFIPEGTFVAEVKDPALFGKALDGFIIGLNKEIKAKATELEDEEKDKTEENRGRGRQEDPEPARGKRGGGASGKERTKNQRATEVLTPIFNRIPSPSNTRKFQLQTPSASKLRLGPPHFRPVIYMDGKHLVVSASAGTAEVAIEALTKKGWKPSAEIEKALADVPNEVVSLAIIDSGQSTPSMLSSFPGTVQAQINTGIALSNAQAAAAAAGSTPAGTPGAGPNALGGRPPGFARGLRDEDDDPEFGDRRRGGRGAFGSMPAPTAKAATPPQMIQLRVETEQLPKPEDIKALLFPTTVWITGDQDGIVVTQRSAFPEQIGLESNAMLVGFMMPMIQAARAHIRSATAPAASQPNAAGPNNNQGMPRPDAAGGRRGGRRDRDDP